MGNSHHPLTSMMINNTNAGLLTVNLIGGIRPLDQPISPRARPSMLSNLTSTGNEALSQTYKTTQGGITNLKKVLLTTNNPFARNSTTSNNLASSQATSSTNG